MGILAVPLIHPPTITIPLEPVPLPTKHKNKKSPAPHQLSHGLKPPPISQSKKEATSKLLADPPSEDGQFQDLAWNGFHGESILEFPGIRVQLIDHSIPIPKT
jgi:hypothetical protein